MEPHEGIEPSLTEYKTVVIPIYESGMLVSGMGTVPSSSSPYEAVFVKLPEYGARGRICTYMLVQSQRFKS